MSRRNGDDARCAGIQALDRAGVVSRNTQHARSVRTCAVGLCMISASDSAVYFQGKVLTGSSVQIRCVSLPGFLGDTTERLAIHQARVSAAVE